MCMIFFLQKKVYFVILLFTYVLNLRVYTLLQLKWYPTQDSVLRITKTIPNKTIYKYLIAKRV